MLPFLINISVFGIWCLLFRGRLNPKCDGSKLFLCIISIQLIIFMLLSPVVSDAQVYARYAETNSYPNIEIGWQLISTLAWSIWPDPKCLVLVSGTALLTSFSVFVWRNSENMALSFLIYICVGFWGMSFCIFRQTVAMSIALIAYEFVKQNKPFHFIATVFAATLFHQTAFIYLFLYPITRFERNHLYHFTVLIGGLLLLLCGPSVIQWLLSAFRNGDLYDLTEISGISFLLFLTTITIVASYFGRNKRNDISLHSLEFACLLQVLALHLSVFTRAIRYYSISMAIVIPNSLNEISDEPLKRISTMGIVTIMLIFYFFIVKCAVPLGAIEWTITFPQLLLFPF